jgi:hypothetical protein
MMPWRGETGALFGRVERRDDGRFFGPMDGASAGQVALPEGLRPPELIVQDELHLISGPLGTMVGLYETAVEALCTRQGGKGAIRPKIIASTATVRRASAQIRHLFGRPSSIFPPPGPSDADTFFSEMSPEPGRLYVGFAAPGRSMKSILLRAYVDLACAAALAYERRPEIADAYMTLAGYFNSLRELGGMRRLVEDDVRTLSAKKDERRPLDWVGPSPHFAARDIHEPLELTSREKTGRIKDSKAKLATPFAATGTTDVLLASNMISVGIDIDRLGLMVVAGQPKTTSEYIQASSRVGRQARWPGLVVTCFNLVKPRDRSHFERFDFYHRTFYRQVEAQSLTPFATPALERGLLGTMLSMARLLYPEMTPPAAAMKLIEHRARIEAGVLGPLRDRVERVGGDADAERAARLVTDRIRSLLDSWQILVESALEGGKRSYSPYDRGKHGKPMLRTALDDDPDADSDARNFVAPTSMRDVEPSVHLWTRHAALEGSN